MNLRLPFSFIFTLSTVYGASFPIVAIALSNTDASNRLIGIAAAMPALGWLIGSPLIPLLLTRMSLKTLMMILLITATLTWCVSSQITSPINWVPARLAFGGTLGLFYRCYEYWICSNLNPAHRGRTLGQYGIMFFGGIIVGASLQPFLGGQSFGFASIGLGLIGCVIWFMFALHPRAAAAVTPLRARGFLAYARLVPMALFGAIVYSMYEEIPVSFLPIYVIEIGYPEAIAALTLSICAMAGLIGTIPMGWLSDVMGRHKTLILSASGGLVGAALLPLLSENPKVFFVGLFCWSFIIEGIYITSLALIADKYQSDGLLHANIYFGMFYAFGALIGPLICGELMEALGPHGLFLAIGLAFGSLLIVTIGSTIQLPKARERDHFEKGL